MRHTILNYFILKINQIVSQIVISFCRLVQLEDLWLSWKIFKQIRIWTIHVLYKFSPVQVEMLIILKTLNLLDLMDKDLNWCLLKLIVQANSMTFRSFDEVRFTVLHQNKWNIFIRSSFVHSSNVQSQETGRPNSLICRSRSK